MRKKIQHAKNLARETITIDLFQRSADRYRCIYGKSFVDWKQWPHTEREKHHEEDKWCKFKANSKWVTDMSMHQNSKPIFILKMKIIRIPGSTNVAKVQFRFLHNLMWFRCVAVDATKLFRCKWHIEEWRTQRKSFKCAIL